MADRRHELRLSEASSKVAQANLLYPFNVSKSEPLLCAAANLADQNFWYWIECGQMREKTGDLKHAKAAFLKARDVAALQNPQGREYSVALDDLGDVHVAQGDIPAALIAYEEGLEIRRTLIQQDPRNAEW